MASVESLNISINTDEVDEKLIKLLERAKKGMPQFKEMIVTQLGDAVIDYAIPLTRVRTGLLRSSYRLSPITTKNASTSITVYNRASDNGKTSYAAYNEFGTAYMAPRLMLTTARERVYMEAPEQIKIALIKLIRGDSSGRYTFKLN